MVGVYGILSIARCAVAEIPDITDGLWAAGPVEVNDRPPAGGPCERDLGLTARLAATNVHDLANAIHAPLDECVQAYDVVAGLLVYVGNSLSADDRAIASAPLVRGCIRERCPRGAR